MKSGYFAGGVVGNLQLATYSNVLYRTMKLIKRCECGVKFKVSFTLTCCSSFVKNKYRINHILLLLNLSRNFDNNYVNHQKIYIDIFNLKEHNTGSMFSIDLKQN